MRASYEKICTEVLRELDDRSRDIVEARFGLANPTAPQTLESIGRKHRITRERVRQIIEYGLAEIQERLMEERDRLELADLLEEVADTLRAHGHLKREDLLIRELGAEENASHVLFLMHVGNGFHRHRETEEHYPFWTVRREIGEEVPSLLRAVISEVERKRALLSDEELAQLRFQKKKLPLKTFLSSLEVSKHLMKSYDGKWGLRHWPEVNPRGVREKAYLVLKQAEKPLHFRDIAERIAQLQLSQNSSKSVLPQTVHNELIKDDRFVLVGRGIYGLASWGYMPGTVKEVLREILRAQKSGLDKEKILSLVAEQRQVKESTVLLNLQDRSLFGRDSEGRYHLKV